MSDTQRCEPADPTVDGWHWLHHPRWGEWPARYTAPCHAGIWPIWQCPDSNWTTPAAHREGYRYLAPVTPASVVAALVEALAECADDLEAEIAARYAGADAYPSEARRRDRDMEPVIAARAALAAYRRQA